MSRLILLVTTSCFLMHLSETRNLMSYRNGNKVKIDIYALLGALLLASLIGLRTSYNDTYAYIMDFSKAPELSAFLSDPNNYALLNNPLFNLYESIVYTYTGNYHLFFMIASVFTVISNVFFLQNLSDGRELSLSLFTYCTLGTYLFSLAAMKQTIAMAILCYAVLALKRKRKILFLVIVFIAGLFHTYAWFFAILLFLTKKPWRLQTWIIIFGTAVIMLTFNESISKILEYADAAGKGTAEELVFSGEGMNMFRVLVYAIVPVTSLLFHKLLEPQMERKQYIMLHMSIISFMFMLLASIDGANMFGRMARYFEIGIIYMFPWIITHLFTKNSQRAVKIAYIILFSFFALRQYGDFSDYSGITFIEFIRTLF